MKESKIKDYTSFTTSRVYFNMNYFKSKNYPEETRPKDYKKLKKGE